MLDIRYLRENFEAAEAALSNRSGAVDLSAFKELDQSRRELLSESETLKAEKNRVSALIGKTKDKSTVQTEIAQMKEVSARIKELDDQLAQTEDELNALLMGCAEHSARTLSGRHVGRRQPGSPDLGREACF